MCISYEGMLQKHICIIERNFRDGSSSIIGLCDNENEANFICHIQSANDPHHTYSFLTFDLVDIIEEWYATNIVND